ncbi:beta-defensin 4B precursor [Equus caballus]|nr:beta-defensin 4B precursor [Equus caballus]AAO32801.1 beta-defensin-1 [Equus caballus]CAJ01797.1 beta defensin 1 [Equus caballus]
MRILHFLLAFLIVFLLPVPGFTAGIETSFSCSQNGGFCISPKCLPGSKQIGTCILPGSKCCRKK